jgi:hypothetical protein
MPPSFFRIVEVTFTAYVVPALLVPVILLIGWIRRRHAAPRLEASRELTRLVRAHFALVLVWALIWIAMILGLPLEKGGSVTLAACWTTYVVANLVLARVLVRFTAAYGSLPQSSASDALFARLLGAMAAQPVMTALAFSVLTRIMGAAWNPLVPGLPAVQEGI